MPKIHGSRERLSSIRKHRQPPARSVPSLGPPTRSSFSGLTDDSLYLARGGNATCCDPVVTIERKAKQSKLEEILKDANDVVFITGAGISTSAGIDDYRSRSRTKMSSRNIFDISALSSYEFVKYIGDLYHKHNERGPTPFHYFMDTLGLRGRLLRHYTQNIDCLDAPLKGLSSLTVSLHGRLDMVICTMCQMSKQIPLERYPDTVTSPCERCTARSQGRILSGKRGTAIGHYRPKILLYGEDCPDDTDITTCFKRDRAEADAVVIAGTRLQIPSLNRFARDLCKRVKLRGGVVVWVSTEKPRLGARLEALLDYELQVDCDEVVM